MMKVEVFRRHARECRALALRMARPEGREQLLKMAESWDDLAAERERLLRLNPSRTQ